MKTIKEIINKLQNLEAEFDIFNSRIFEFAQSTNNGDIDKNLLNKYIGSINNYILLIKAYKKEILSMGSEKKNFNAQKDLVLFRLEKLGKIFNNTLKKIEIINSSFTEKIQLDKEEDLVDFESRNEMLEINKILYDFYNNYNKNLEFQKTYNINISLDNNFELKKEEELTSLELVTEENNYIINLNKIFETLEELDIDFNVLFEKALELDKRFFSNFVNEYFPQNNKSFIFQKFDEIFKDNYVNKNFIVKESIIYKDFLTFKKLVIKEHKNLNTLVIMTNVIKKYKSFELLNSKYNLFSDYDFFEKKYEIFNTIIVKDFKKASEAINNLKINIKSGNIKTIELSNKIFLTSLELLKNFDSIYTEYIAKLSFGFMGNFFDIFDKEEISEKYIKQGLSNIKEKFNKELKDIILNGSDINNLKCVYKLIKTYNKHLLEVQKNIISLEKYLLTGIKYSSSSSLKKYGTSTNLKLKNLQTLFFLNSSLVIKSEFEKYITKILNTKYSDSKRSYYAAKNSGRSGSSSSSWSSSSSSSFSSSYSSSGSSSW